MSKDSLYPPDWLKIAKKDWKRIRIMLEEGDGPGAGFFLQQALEKFLKAYLLEKGWKLKKIHELDALLDQAVKFNPELKEFYPLCERVGGYYFSERYPSLGQEELSASEVKKDLAEAKRLINLIFPAQINNSRN